MTHGVCYFCGGGLYTERATKDAEGRTFCDDYCMNAYKRSEDNGVHDRYTCEHALDHKGDDNIERKCMHPSIRESDELRMRGLPIYDIISVCKDCPNRE